MAYAEWYFRSHKPTSDGATVSDHRDSAARQWALLGKKKAEAVQSIILGPDFPIELTYLWSWFLELAAGIDAGLGAPVVTWRDVAAWASLMRISLEPWESRALVDLGQLRVSILLEQQKKQPSK